MCVTPDPGVVRRCCQGLPGRCCGRGCCSWRGLWERPRSGTACVVTRSVLCGTVLSVTIGARPVAVCMPRRGLVAVRVRVRGEALQRLCGRAKGYGCPALVLLVVPMVEIPGKGRSPAGLGRVVGVDEALLLRVGRVVGVDEDLLLSVGRVVGADEALLLRVGRQPLVGVVRACSVGFPMRPVCLAALFLLGSAAPARRRGFALFAAGCGTIRRWLTRLGRRRSFLPAFLQQFV